MISVVIGLLLLDPAAHATHAAETDQCATQSTLVNERMAGTNPANAAGEGRLTGEASGVDMLDADTAAGDAFARSDVPAFMVMDVVAAAARLEAAGRRVIHMEVGQPAAAAPASRDRRGASGARGGRVGYTEIARHSAAARADRAPLRERYGVDVDPGRVVVTTGSSAGFMLAFLALFEPGDRVAMPSPGYPPYRNILAALGCEAVAIEISASNALGAHAGG